jgi:hypothetical protein
MGVISHPRYSLSQEIIIIYLGWEVQKSWKSFKRKALVGREW